MAPGKTEVLLIMDKRSFHYPINNLRNHEVVWKKSINYLGVQLDQRLSFGEHLQIANANAIQCEANLARIMPNIGGPRDSKLLYAAPI